MTTIALPTFPDASLLTHSATKCWHACRRRFYFQYVLGIRKAAKSEPLRVGTMWHLGVGSYESGMPIGDVVDMLRQAYADTPCPSYLSPEEFQVEEEKVVAMVRAHHHVYRHDQILESLAVEQAFVLPIINPATGKATPSFQDAGMIDRIARLPDGTIAIVERKTTAESIEPDSAYWKALRNDPQISRYLRAARALGHDVTKVVYDVVKKPQIRPKEVIKAVRAHATAQGHYFGVKLSATCPERETPRMYGARLFDDMISRTAHYFARNEIARLDGDLEEFAQDQWQTQQEIRQAMANGRYYRNPSACLEPYTCEYLDVCSTLHATPDEIPQGFRRVERLHEELPLPKQETPE
jgi:hypothetical protein